MEHTLEHDSTMASIGRVIELANGGAKATAAQEFAVLWAQLGPHGDPLHRLTLAHWMADLQDDPAEELLWDLRALAAADDLTEDRAVAAGLAGTAGLYPSLHLNLGEAYRRTGDLASAAQHLALGRAAVPALPDDGYGRMITQGLESLAQRLTG